MTEEIIRRQRKIVVEAMEKANMANWPYGAKAQLNEKMATKLCIELLANGLVVLGEGENNYAIMAMKGANVEEYLKKSKEEM